MRIMYIMLNPICISMTGPGTSPLSRVSFAIFLARRGYRQNT
jgi:hypothetical protein